ncbi:hypothetical protein DFH11DRAFT_1699960, partial [Phellopilus nigrolimitatus]
MAAPIRLWRYKRIEETDDAGVTIIKSDLKFPPATVRPRYECQTQHPRTLNCVPKLAYFCIRSLLDSPDQLYYMGPARLRLSKDIADRVLLRALLPAWKTTEFSLLDVNPLLWATLVQIYENAPSLLSSYPIHLSDPHLPLLQQIPATQDFALITILDLQRCMQLTDDNIFELKVLHNLCALDVGGTKLSTHGVRRLSQLLLFDDKGGKRGPWALRILKMRGCASIDKDIYNYLLGFPLLCAADLRDTLCSVRNIKPPFFQARDPNIFDPSMSEAVEHLAKSHKGVFSHHKPVKLVVQERSFGQKRRPLSSSMDSRPKSNPSMHNSFWTLLPSEGTSRTGRPPVSRCTIQSGNTDALEIQQRRAEIQQRKAEREERLANRRQRDDEEDGRTSPPFPHDDDYGYPCGDCSCSCDDCEREGSGLNDDDDEDRFSSEEEEEEEEEEGEEEG